MDKLPDYEEVLDDLRMMTHVLGKRYPHLPIVLHMREKYGFEEKK